MSLNETPNQEANFYPSPSLPTTGLSEISIIILIIYGPSGERFISFEWQHFCRWERKYIMCKNSVVSSSCWH